MIILKNNLERWLVKLKCWLLFCFFGNCFHLCKVQSLRVRWEIGHHIHVGGFFISIRKVHDSVRYSGVYPRADAVMAEASLLQTLNNGTGTPFFCAYKFKST